MKIFNLNSRLARRATATIAFGLLLGAQTAIACTVGNWTGGNSGAGTVLASGPDGPDGKPAIARYSGLCAMQTEVSSNAWVQDDSPGGIARIRARFYVLNGLAAGQSAVIYRGFSSTGGTGSLFTVRLATDGTVRLIDNATAAEVQQTASTPWISVEIDWSQGAGDGVISLSVNGQAPDALSNLNNTGSGLQSVRLGNLLGAGGTVNFDGYESRRTNEIGRLLACNADPSDEQVNILDALAVINEINEVELSAGQPDCDEDGFVTILDALDIINIINS